MADISFIPAMDLDRVGGVIADPKRMVAERGRELKVFGQTTVVCADTEKEARAYLDWYVDELGDFEAAGNLLSTLFANTMDAEGSVRQQAEKNPFLKQMLRRLVAGHGGEPLVGTPEQVVNGMLKLSEAGFDGSTISWVNYEDGLMQFREQLLPLMISAAERAGAQTDLLTLADPAPEHDPASALAGSPALASIRAQA